MVAIATIVLAAVGVCSLGEWLHARRIRRLSRLAFGPESEPRRWTRQVPWLRVAAVGLLAWGLAQLMAIRPRSHRPSQMPEGGFRHILLVLDVSPSMQLKDAGRDGTQTRMQRAHEVLMSVFERVALDQVRISVVAFYNGAKPVVIDTFDLEVVKNILEDLPLDQAFDIGKTKILDGLRMAADIARPWQPGSTVLVLVSDGDTVPDSGMPDLPKSVSQTLVLGVGDARAGKFIDGHQSRQDASTLRQIAGRLRGSYHDANLSHLPSDQLERLARVAPLADSGTRGLREAALAAVGLGSAILGILPLALAGFGSRWQPAPAWVRADRSRRSSNVPVAREVSRPGRDGSGPESRSLISRP